MNGRKKLAGQRIAVLVADGFEQVELTAPVAALKEAGAEVDIISLHPGRIRGMNLHQPAELVAVDKTLDQVRARDYDGLLIPGGFINPDHLRQSARARDFVRDFDVNGKPIATLCHGPWLLASAGLTPNRTLTSWPGVRDDMVNAGATWLDQEVVRDGNWVSSRGPQDMVAFIRDMLQLYAGAPASNGALRRRHSDPQREEPSTIPGQAMRWLGTPSVRTMLGLALLGVGVVAANRGRGGGGEPPAAPGS
ncbi:MAG: type 1 glutamine amidotransferase domain-containing protein [Massilia sp.]